MPSKNKLPIFKSDSEKNFFDKLHNATIQFTAVTVWTYVFLKLFVFDVDIWAFRSLAPEYLWILDFKSVIVVVLIAVTLFVFRNRWLILWVFYILFYPLLILLRIPIFILKQRSWTLALAALNSVIAIFRNFKRNTITGAVVLCTIVVIAYAQDLAALYIAATTLLAATILVYSYQLRSSMRPSAVFLGYTKAFAGIRKIGHSAFELSEEIKGLPAETLDEQQMSKWTETLQMSVLFNRICHFSAKKLRDYQKSEWRIIPSILSIVYLLVFSIISFASVYYSLFKVDPRYFRFSEDPTYFTFFYYSFNNVVFNSITEVVAALPLSQAVYMLQLFLILMLGLIMVSLIISYRTEKYSREIDEIIEQIEQHAAGMESHIRSEFGMKDIQAAIRHLEEIKSSLIKIVYAMSSDIAPTSQDN